MQCTGTKSFILIVVEISNGKVVYTSLDLSRAVQVGDLNLRFIRRWTKGTKIKCLRIECR